MVVSWSHLKSFVTHGTEYFCACPPLEGPRARMVDTQCLVHRLVGLPKPRTRNGSFLLSDYFDDLTLASGVANFYQSFLFYRDFPPLHIWLFFITMMLFSVDKADLEFLNQICWFYWRIWATICWSYATGSWGLLRGQTRLNLQWTALKTELTSPISTEYNLSDDR